MARRKGSERKKPAAWLYLPLRWLCLLAGKLIFGLKVTGQDALPESGPVLLLSSHEGMTDFILLIAALKKRRVQFVATERQFRNPKLHWAYVRLGMIPKIQFHTDPRCVMGILRTLKNGGTVGIFPAGQTSMCGVPGAVSPAIAHLVKRCGATVCTAGLRGGFLTYPRFAGRFYRGKTEVHLERLYTPEQMKTVSEDEIFRTLTEKLDYDDYAWQESGHVRFRGGKRADGMDKILFRCPDCGADGTVRAQGNRIVCQNCGSAAAVGEDMHLHPEKPDSRFFTTLRDWYRWQEDILLKNLTAGENALALNVRIQTFDEDAFAYTDAGEGVLRLDRETLRICGTVHGQETEISVSHDRLPGLTGDPREFLEIYHDGLGILRCRPGDPAEGWKITAVKAAQERLSRRRGEGLCH